MTPSQQQKLANAFAQVEATFVAARLADDPDAQQKVAWARRHREKLERLLDSHKMDVLNLVLDLQPTEED